MLRKSSWLWNRQNDETSPFYGGGIYSLWLDGSWLFSDAVSTKLDIYLWVISEEQRRGKKSIRTYFKISYLCNFFLGLNKITKEINSSLLGEIRSKYIRNTNHNRYCLSKRGWLYFFTLLNMVIHSKVRTVIEGVWEQRTEENTWSQRRASSGCRKLHDEYLRNF
jgi:hypothetical protein